MYLFHGTSYSNGLNILLEGFKNQNPIWECSNPNKTYFYKNESLDEGVQNALDQALISIGLNNESKGIVLVFDSNKVKNQKPDESCVGMSQMAVEAQISSLDGLISVYESENLFLESKMTLISCSNNPLVNMNPIYRLFYKTLSLIEPLKYKKKHLNFKKIK